MPGVPVSMMSQVAAQARNGVSPQRFTNAMNGVNVNPAPTTLLSAPLATDSFTRTQAPAAGSSVCIVYNNDVHEQLQREPKVVTAMKTETARNRQLGKDVLTLNSGDANVGPEDTEWNLTVQMLNQIHYDAVTTGNHEFDTGSRGYAGGLWHANFPTLVSNLEIEPGTSLGQLVQAGRIQTGPRIINTPHGSYGVIGVTTPELDEVVNKSAKREGEEVESLDETIQVVQSQVNDLQRQGVNKVILLSHMGFTNEQQLAQRVQGVDVIVGGHSHDVINGVTPGYNWLSGPTGEPVLILQAGKNGEYIGVTDVNFDSAGRVVAPQNHLIKTAPYPADPQSVAMRNSVLGVPKPLVVMGTAYDCNGNEYHPDAVAQFTADTIRSMTGTDIALVRSSQFRTNFDPGVFTDQDLKALMPFSDKIMTLPLTGAEILAALTQSAQGIVTHKSHPGMLHASGMKVTLDSHAGQVRQASVQNKFGQWELLDPNKTYNVATDQFAIFNHEMPSLSHPDRVTGNTNQIMRYFLEQGLKQAGAGGRPVQFHDDGRLQIV